MPADFPSFLELFPNMTGAMLRTLISLGVIEGASGDHRESVIEDALPLEGGWNPLMQSESSTTSVRLNVSWCFTRMVKVKEWESPIHKIVSK
jgi:hypothetical protein